MSIIEKYCRRFKIFRVGADRSSLPMWGFIELRMGALGLRGTLLDAAQSNGVGLSVKSDSMWLRTQSETVEGTEGAEADVSRLRLALEGSRAMALADGGTFTPSAEFGVRHDGGDAETGTRLEVGAGVRYASGALSIEGAVRRVLAHRQSGYAEWVASGSIRLDVGYFDPTFWYFPRMPTNGELALESLWCLRYVPANRYCDETSQ